MSNHRVEQSDNWVQCGEFNYRPGTGNILLRKADMSDADFVYRVRFKDPVVVENSWDGSVVEQYKHLDFFREHVDFYFIIVFDGEDVGFVRDMNGEVSICLLENFRNKGIGSKVLENFYGKATIKINNVNSLLAFQKAGFKIVGYILEKKIVFKED